MKVGELPTYAAEVLATAKDLVHSQVAEFIAKIQELDVAVLLFGVLSAVVIALLLPQLLRMKAAADKAAAEKAAAGGKRLWDAASDGNVDEVRTLCSEWAGNPRVISWRGINGYTPLNMACFNDRHEVVSVLIGTAGVEINMADNYGWSPLWWAAYKGNTQSVRVLLSAKERGLDLNQKPTRGSDLGKTPLKIAREENKAEVVALLEEAGARDV